MKNDDTQLITVITLYYLGEMTCEEISEFLGVSVSAIKDRLHRARQRLKKEEPMIRDWNEVLTGASKSE